MQILLASSYCLAIFQGSVGYIKKMIPIYLPKKQSKKQYMRKLPLDAFDTGILHNNRAQVYNHNHCLVNIREQQKKKNSTIVIAV